jgi:hypothetical protein
MRYTSRVHHRQSWTIHQGMSGRLGVYRLFKQPINSDGHLTKPGPCFLSPIEIPDNRETACQTWRCSRPPSRRGELADYIAHRILANNITPRFNCRSGGLTRVLHGLSCEEILGVSKEISPLGAKPHGTKDNPPFARNLTMDTHGQI